MECAVCQVKASRRCTRCWGVVYCSEEHQRQDWLEHKKDCTSPMVLKKEPDPVFGEYWVAARDLSPGTLLVKELPTLKLSAWPYGINDFYEWDDDATCLACGIHTAEPSNKYCCSKCSWPVCNLECETASIHADNECKVFQEKKFKFPPIGPGLVSPRRIDWAVSAIRASGLKTSKPGLFRELLNLQHKPTIPMPPIFKDMMKNAVVVLDVLLDISSMGMSKEEIIKLFWVVKLNTFNCAEMQNERERVEHSRTDCVYTKLSKFNNSCAPNCAYSMKPKAPEYQMTVRTAVAVKKGEPLWIPYNDYLCVSFEERQEAMMERFFFVCKCKRCLDPTELGTYHSAIACQSCYEDRKKGTEMNINEGYLLPEDPVQSFMERGRAVWKCNRCSKKTGARTFLPMVKKLGQLVKKPVTSLKMVEKLKEEYAEKLLHPNHWIFQLASQGVLQLWDRMDAKDSDEFPFQTFQSHLLYRMANENILSPGISHDRAHLQRDYVIAVLTTNQLQKGNKTREEKLELVKTCYEFIREANMFFEYFQDGVPQGTINLLATSNLKEVVETLLEKFSPEVVENP